MAAKEFGLHSYVRGQEDNFYQLDSSGRPTYQSLLLVWLVMSHVCPPFMQDILPGACTILTMLDNASMKSSKN